MVEEYINFTKQNGYFQHKRNQQSKYWMYETINEHLKRNFYNNPDIAAKLEAYEKLVLNDEISSFVAANRLLTQYFGK